MEPVISKNTGRDCGFGSYGVTEIIHCTIPLPCGLPLAAKLWYPSSQLPEELSSWKTIPIYKPDNEGVIPGEKFPVVLEYLPYRKSDGTLSRDHQRHSWMTSHGYVIARVDMRGTGDSEGLYYDEYQEQELTDACDIIDWFSKQKWCNGRVGMYGKSWGGFNGLQVAYLQPPALKTIISLYSTDQRYENDIHWEGGCVLGHAMLSWAAFMFSMNALPPDPRSMPTRWREEWQQRLSKASESWAKQWLSHQIKDDYWKHGSISTDPSRVKIPVLAIGGWRDPYHDAVFRMLENLPSVRGIVGPWAHDWPDCSQPGPHIQYLQQCLQWWDYHLKEKQNGAMNMPKLRVYLQDSIPPAVNVKFRPGKWVLINQWPPKKDSHINYMADSNSMQLLRQDDTLVTVRAGQTTAFTQLFCGSKTGEWFGLGINDGPGDQRHDDVLSVCWTSPPLEADLPILGFPVLHIRVTSPAANQVLLAARICDVMPDGRSTLVSYGVLNLSHREGHEEEEVTSLTPGQEYDVTMTLHSASHVIPAGHCLRLAVSPNYWPMVWPSPTASELIIHTDGDGKTGASTWLQLPTCYPVESETTEDCPLVLEDFSCERPDIGPDLETMVHREPQHDVTIIERPSCDLLSRHILSDFGRVHYKLHGVITDEKVEEEYTIEHGKPTSAKATVRGEVSLSWPDVDGGTEVKVETLSTMTSDEGSFHLNSSLKTMCNNDCVYENTWNRQIPRQFV